MLLTAAGRPRGGSRHRGAPRNAAAGPASPRAQQRSGPSRGRGKLLPQPPELRGCSSAPRPGPVPPPSRSQRPGLGRPFAPRPRRLPHEARDAARGGGGSGARLARRPPSTEGAEPRGARGQARTVRGTAERRHPGSRGRAPGRGGGVPARRGPLPRAALGSAGLRGGPGPAARPEGVKAPGAGVAGGAASPPPRSPSGFHRGRGRPQHS